MAVKKKKIFRGFKVIIEGDLEKTIRVLNGCGKVKAKIKDKKGGIIIKEVSYNEYAQLVQKQYKRLFPGKKIEIGYINA